MHEVMIEGAGSLIELLLLVILAHIGLDDADAGDVLLDGIVQTVVLAEDAAEDRHGCKRDLEDGIAKEKGDDHVDDCHGAAGDECHDDGEDGKHRAADGHADDHHVGLLDVRDIGREPRHERACREAVDIGEREALDLVEQVMPQVLGKAGRTDGTGDACSGAERKRDQVEADQDDSRRDDAFKRLSCCNLIDELRREERNGALDDGFEGYEQRGLPRILAVLAQRLRQRMHYLPQSVFWKRAVRARLHRILDASGQFHSGIAFFLSSSSSFQ